MNTDDGVTEPGPLVLGLRHHEGTEVQRQRLQVEARVRSAAAMVRRHWDVPLGHIQMRAVLDALDLAVSALGPDGVCDVRGEP